MQVNRIHTAPDAPLFAPTGGQTDAEKSAQSLLPGAAGLPAPVRATPAAETKHEAPAPQG